MNYDRAAIEAMRDTRERLGGCSLMTLRENKLVLDWLELAAEVERLRESNESLHGQVEFGKHLNKCTIEVAQYPEWKKVVIGDNKTSLAAILNDYIQLQARVTVLIATLSHRIIQSLSEQHGSLRAASRAVGLSPTYLCQVARGNATLSIQRTIEILRNNPLEGDE